MNHRIHICLLAAGLLTACGQPPSPSTPRAVPQNEVTTTTTTTTTTTVVTPPPTTTTPPPKPPPRTTTKTTVKPPPPPPKPPTRLVVADDLRRSIESRLAGQPFSDVWAGMQTELNGLCPAKKPCVGYALVVDTSTEETEDCIVVGIKMPDPLYEGGKITFRVNNKNRCTGG